MYPLSFAPGEACQFDWSHEVVLINGTTVTVKITHVRLCHSRMLFVRGLSAPDPGNGVRTRTAALSPSFTGNLGAAFYDNMKTAVAGRERVRHKLKGSDDGDL